MAAGFWLQATGSAGCISGYQLLSGCVGNKIQLHKGAQRRLKGSQRKCRTCNG